MQEFTIQLRVNFGMGTDAKEREQIIREAGRAAAKHWFTMATMIGGKHKPQIKMFGGDFIEGEAEISLAEDIPVDAQSTDEEMEAAREADQEAKRAAEAQGEQP